MIISVVRRPGLVGRLESPIVLSVLIVGAVLATALPVAFGTPPGAGYATASKIALCALMVVLLSRLGWWRRAGFLSLPGRRDLPWIAAPSLLLVGALVAVIVAGPAPMEPASVLAFAAVAFGTGLSEEGLFRGVLLESLRPRGVALSVVGTTAVFSTIHLAGLFAGATIEATVTQVLLGGIPIGLAFAALRLSTRSIWPLVVLHALNNFTSFLMSGHWEAVAQDMSRFAVAGLLQLGLLAMLLVYGVWFVWRAVRSSRRVAAPMPSSGDRGPRQ